MNWIQHRRLQTRPRRSASTTHPETCTSKSVGNTFTGAESPNTNISAGTTCMWHQPPKMTSTNELDDSGILWSDNEQQIFRVRFRWCEKRKSTARLAWTGASAFFSAVAGWRQDGDLGPGWCWHLSDSMSVACRSIPVTRPRTRGNNNNASTTCQKLFWRGCF